MTRLISVVTVITCVAFSATARAADKDFAEHPGVEALSFRYAKVTGIGKEEGVCRRDPSDVIKVGDTCYVYYTKVVKSDLPENQRRLYPSGYPGRIYYAVSRDDGRQWEERGEAIGLGKPGAFDSFGVFTPNIVAHGNQYWLYYTAVQPTPGMGGVFENNATTDPTAIAVAVAGSPDGPFERVPSNPVLEISNRRDAFDSYRVDDACLVLRRGKVWLYYKGRCAAHGRGGPRQTRMGVAIADHPAGPFAKLNEGRPVQDSGHEVQVFAHKDAVASLVSPTGPNGRSLQYADGGLDFRVILRGLKHLPKAPGLHRPELTNASATTKLPAWGIAMATYGGDPYLVRYECVWGRP